MKPTALPLLRRPLHATRLLLAALVGTALAACGNGMGSRPTPPPDEVERFGALELITHFRAQRGGDAARFAWQHVAHWSLRWQGQPLVIETLGGMFGDKPQQLTRVNAVFVIERGQGLPQLLVNVGDPNNTSAFHLIRQQDDALQVRLLCITSGGSNSVGWAQHVLRKGQDEQVATGLPGRTSWLQGPRRETLQAGSTPDAGGRYLQLGDRCLFDTATDAVLWMARDSSAATWGPAIVSPQGTRIVRLGSIEAGEGNSRSQTALLSTRLMHLPEGVVPGSVAAHQTVDQTDIGQLIALPRERMRYPAASEIDAAWVLHHFRWTRDNAGAPKGERLVERAGFKPLPHRGLLAERDPEYRVEGLRESQLQYFTDFMVKHFEGRVMPPSPSAFTVRVLVRMPQGEVPISVHEDGFYVSLTGRSYHPGSVDDPEVHMAVVRRLGQAFDAELASGRLDHWFTAAAGTR